MDTRHFHKHLDDSMRRLVGERGTIVCAVSGGADSMALLHGLHRVCETRKRTWSLHVAHLDHGIPANAADMMAFVRETAETLEVSFHADFVDVPALSRETNESIEEAGRKVRYAFLERVCRATNADALALAHHADDQAETILHRVLRGTGLRGLSGIPESRRLCDDLPTIVVRPLLPIRRDDLIAYLRHRSLPWMHDATNDDVLAATRNRIRNELLPVIEQTINPQVTTALVRLGELASQASALIDSTAAAAFGRCLVDADARQITFDADALSNECELIRAEIIGLAIDRLETARGEIGFERLRAAAQVIDASSRDSRIELSDGAIVERRGRFVTVRRTDTANPKGACESRRAGACAP